MKCTLNKGRLSRILRDIAQQAVPALKDVFLQQQPADAAPRCGEGSAGVMAGSREVGTAADVH